MRTYAQLQDKLGTLVGLPQDLPIIYLLGDTGAGKTCLVRQLLGTTPENFPSVRRVRTTVAPTEFIITNESTFRAGFIIRPAAVIAQFVTEILEQFVTSGFHAVRAQDDADLSDVLADSPDQRFRLRCFLDEQTRRQIAQQLSTNIIPALVTWADEHFPQEKDESTILALGLEECSDALDAIKSRVLEIIASQIKAACDCTSDAPYPEMFAFETSNRSDFIQRLKRFLSVEEGSVSPAVEKARVRGKLRSQILPEELELVVVDGEGIGHDAREARLLSTRHFDYFYDSDAIVLVEDSETPFRAGGKSALAAIEKSGYLSKMCLAFSRLDLVQADEEGREFQIREVEKALRNVLHALREEQVAIEKSRIDVRFLGNMHQHVPDLETQEQMRSLLLEIQQRHGAVRTLFVAPRYDYELLAGFLAQATAALRQSWAGYIRGEGNARAAPWQTQKAFTKRMSWRWDEYRYLKPVAELSDLLKTHLRNLVFHPIGWAEDITVSHQAECVELLRGELSNELIKFVRRELIDDHHPKWGDAANLSGGGSTYPRRRLIMEVIESSAPDLTGGRPRAFKDAVKALIENAINRCSTAASS
jgi:hypothetical protein